MGWSDGIGYLVADARPFVRVADKTAGSTVNRAHSAPLGRQVIVVLNLVVG